MVSAPWSDSLFALTPPSRGGLPRSLSTPRHSCFVDFDQKAAESTRRVRAALRRIQVNSSRKRRFSDSQSSCFPFNETRVGHSPTDYYDPAQLAEAFACTVDEPCEQDIQKLISVSPTEVPARGVMQNGAHSFTAGAFSKDGSTGLRRNCMNFPRVTEALTQFVRSRAPTLKFGAVAVFTNLEADFHQDINNCPSSVNWVHPLSSFQDGGIWVESPEGDTVLWARGKQRPEGPFCQ